MYFVWQLILRYFLRHFLYIQFVRAVSVYKSRYPWYDVVVCCTILCIYFFVFFFISIYKCSRSFIFLQHFLDLFVSMILCAHVTRFSVSCMRDFLLVIIKLLLTYSLLFFSNTFICFKWIPKLNWQYGLNLQYLQ